MDSQLSDCIHSIDCLLRLREPPTEVINEMNVTEADAIARFCHPHHTQEDSL